MLIHFKSWVPSTGIGMDKMGNQMSLELVGFVLFCYLLSSHSYHVWWQQVRQPWVGIPNLSLFSCVAWDKEHDLPEPQHLFLYKRNAWACVLSHNSRVRLLWTGDLHAPLSMGFAGKSTGVSCYSLLQEIFLTQGLNLCLLYLLHWQAGSWPLAPPGKFTRGMPRPTLRAAVKGQWNYSAQVLTWHLVWRKF